MKRIICAMVMATLMISLAGCGTESTQKDPADKIEVNIAALKGPTAMGMAKLMEDNDNGEAADNYKFTLASAPDELTGAIVSGEFDIAAVPTNLASVLYNKTEGKIQVAAINTLGVLYIVENGDSIKTIADLAGKKIVATGQGAVPEYALNFVLEQAGITDAQIEYKTEHAEAAALLASGEADVALLPQPFVTSAMMKNKSLRIALDLTKEWEKNADKQSELVMGCIVVQKAFAEEHPNELKAFLEGYSKSAEFVADKANLKDAAALIEKFDIIKADIAEKALPLCNIVFVDGRNMQKSLSGFLNVLFEANAKAVGGKMPADDFYYNAK